MEQKALQVAMTVLVFALLLRLAGAWEKEDVARTLLFISSGRMVTQEPVTEPEKMPEPEAEEDTAVIPVFGENQQDLVQVNADWPVDTLELLQQPLSWDLMGEEPTVLILHSHATESYEKEASYQETSPYRTLDTDYNMVSIGDRVARILESGGIRVIHDRTLYDYPNYNDAYINAREAIETHLAENPTISMVLDLHRDAAEDETGKQKRSAVTIDGVSTANLMLVMGSNKGNREFPNWEQNLALAVKLQAQLEQAHQGLCRPINLVTSRYNQDLCTGALLVEVGTAGNTRAEALAAAEYLAEGILCLAKGANH